MKPQTIPAEQATPAATRPRAEIIAARHSATLAHYSQSDQDAALRLYHLVKRNPGTSGGNAAAKLLLGLYNGTRFPFDLTDLRVLDNDNFEDAMTVLRMDGRRTWCEIHVLLDAILGAGATTGAEFEYWAYNLKLRRRCKKEDLPARGHAEREAA